MSKFNGKGILAVVGVVAVIGVAYVAMSDRAVPDEGTQGTVGIPVDQHQANKTLFYEEMNKAERIKTLAQIAVKLEQAPAEGQKLLLENRWTKADFDKMLEDIRNDDEQYGAFQEAKRQASQR